MLHAEPDNVDALRFLRLVGPALDEAGTGAAREQLAGALALWARDFPL